MVDSILRARYEESDAVVIGVPFDHNDSVGAGAKLGPRKIKEALDEQIELFDRFTRSEPAREYGFGYREIREAATWAPDRMVDEVTRILSTEDRFFVLLGGVHSVTIPALNALREKHDPGAITVVQIDAHFDLRDDDSDYNDVNPSRFAHCTVMKRAFDFGFGILPIGVRTIYKGEFEFVVENGIRFFEWGRADVPVPSMEEITDSIRTDKIYLTIDVDGFDPAVMPATGTPVPGGLTWEYGEALIRHLMRTKDVVAADVVEVAPVEHSSQTEYNAAQLVYVLLSLCMATPMHVVSGP